MLLNAAMFSSRILSKENVDAEKINADIKKLKSLISSTFIYLKLLTSLRNLLEGSKLSDAKKRGWRKLIVGLADEQTAYPMHILAIIEEDGEANENDVLIFINEFGLSSEISEAAQKGFQKFFPTV